MARNDAAQPRRNRGRPAHQPTDKSRQTVEMLLGYGVPAAKVAFVLGIAQSTLYVHYADEIRRSSAKVEAMLIGNLMRLSKGNDGAALRAVTYSLTHRFGWSQWAPRPN